MTLDERNDEVNKALESRFNQLNAALEKHEAWLKGMMVPKDAWVMCDSYADEDVRSGDVYGEHQTYIGMIKLRGQWRLCHANHYESYSGLPEEISWKPIVEASIEERISAAEHIEKLRHAVVKVKEELVPEVEKAIQKLVEPLD